MVILRSYPCGGGWIIRGKWAIGRKGMLVGQHSLPALPRTLPSLNTEKPTLAPMDIPTKFPKILLGKKCYTGEKNRKIRRTGGMGLKGIKKLAKAT